MNKHANRAIKLTKNQYLVMDTLIKAGKPLSAYMILDELRDVGFRAPLQVYRALKHLLEIGRVHKLESLNAFIACNHVSCEKFGATAFVICDKCEQVEEVCDKSVTLFLDQLAKKAKIKMSKSNVELHGICNTCEHM